jgi:butyrate kinase
MAYLGTNYQLIKLTTEGAILIRDALYQIAKIGAMSAVLGGNVDAIILTGGLAYQESHIERIKKMVGFISDVVVFPGEDEIKALAFNGLMALDGKIEIKTYS